MPSTVKLLHQRINKKINRDQEGCRLDLKPSPDEINNSAGKGTSGMDKSRSVVDRMNINQCGEWFSLPA